MNTAEYIVKRLEELGINEFFGVPGDYNFNLIYAVKNNTRIKWIGCTNELNAGYAADGYARIRGYGALITTYGVGELSAINAIAGSMAENVPVVHLVGLPATEKIDKKNLIHHNFQEVNYQNFINAYKSVTAATAFLSRDNAKLEIDRVLKTLVKEKKPVYIAIPDDIAQMEISDRNAVYEWISDKNNLETAAKKIAEKIAKSKKPVIIGDVLIKRFDARIEYQEFVSKSQIPVSNFLMGTNIIDMDSENYIGGYFGSIRNPIAQKYIEETDCCITVGAIYSDLNTFGQNLPFKINDQIAIYGTFTYIDGKRYDNIKMSDLLNELTTLVEPKNIEFEKPNIGLKPVEDNEEKLNSAYFYQRIQEFIKENDIVFAETGTIPYSVGLMYFPQSCDIQFQALWGSIGWATPAALGASIAKPQSKVILITGEGSHMISAMEIGTMIRYGIKPIVIVINNNGYSTERLLSNNPQDDFNDIAQINYSKFARAFEGDIWATKAATCSDFDKALKVTQIMNKMCYIEVCMDSLDVPNISKELIDALKNKNGKNFVPTKNTIMSAKEIDNLTLDTQENGFEYETVVHKGITEEEN